MSNSAEYTGKDQNWQDEQTTYWFDIDGDVYGVVESDSDSKIVDVDGCPIDGMGGEQEIRSALENAVTDEMRAE